MVHKPRVIPSSPIPATAALSTRDVCAMDWYAIARAQQGVISRRQLHDAGLSEARIASLRRHGELEPDPRRGGVWRVTGAPRTWLAECAAAALATESVLSHATAASLWGLSFGSASGPIHVTRGDRDHVNPVSGVRVHRVPLADGDIEAVRDLPVTSVRRTTIDCLRALPFSEGIAVLDRALQRRWLSLPDLQQHLADGPNRWGNGKLRRLAAHCAAGDAESERRLHQVLREAGIVGWVANLPIDLGFAVLEFDVVFPELRLIVEVDGWLVHSKRDRFQSDRTRQNAVAALGWSVLRFTWYDIVNRPVYVVLKVREMLARLSR